MVTTPDRDEPVLGSELPPGARFAGPEPTSEPGWRPGDAPLRVDLDACVACGLCLPHCPTYALTGEESASPRGRIAAMRAVDEGHAEIDDVFMRAMDLCLVCRACEDVCPSHAPFGRLMEGARSQIEPDRSAWQRLWRWAGLDLVLGHRRLLWGATLLQPIVTPFLPRRIRVLVPRPSSRFGRLRADTAPPSGVAERGTVAMLSGCVQDRWFREVNEATIRVLARNGWRVVVPRRQTCCGALHAHNGRLGSARRLARADARAFADADHVIANAAGCGAHMATYEDLVPGTGLPVVDVMAFLDAEGIDAPPGTAGVDRVAYHDACHALRAQGIREAPRRLLRTIAGLVVVDVEDGDRCCGAAGIYGLTEPEMSQRLRADTARAIQATGALIVASANPGCMIQIAAGLREAGATVEVVHPIQLLDRAYRGGA